MRSVGVDSSALVDYLRGSPGKDLEFLDELLANRQVRMIPVVLSELLTSTQLDAEIEAFLKAIPSSPLVEGYWVRAGETRRALRRRGFNASLADTLIAQFCVDHELPLLTRDAGFRPFAEHCGLTLAI